jgi:hypothetical protein
MGWKTAESEVDSQQRQGIFLFPTAPSPVQRVPGLKRPVNEVDYYLHLVPRLRMRGSVPLLFHMSLWRCVLPFVPVTVAARSEA